MLPKIEATLIWEPTYKREAQSRMGFIHLWIASKLKFLSIRTHHFLKLIIRIPSAGQTSKMKSSRQNVFWWASERAFRQRIPDPEYADRVLKIYQLNRENGRSIKDALMTPLAMILSSPSFLYIMEDTPSNGNQSVSEAELAHRISYFLWSRPAPDSLLKIASQGSLSNPDLLRKTDVMLQHPHSWALAEGFFSHWADLKRFDEIAINEADHIGWNNGVRESARLEAQHLFHTMVKENRSLTDLIDSEFTVINDLLAFHYGLAYPDQGSEFVKVSLPADSPRGGLIGTTAFLTMGSNGERSSPIIRGALLMEKFLHREPAASTQCAGIGAGQ